MKLPDRLRALLTPRWSWHLPSWETEFLSGLACITLSLAVLVAAALALWLSFGHWRAPAPALVFLLAAAFGVFYEAKIDAKGFEWEDVAQRLVGIIVGAFAYAGLLRLIG